MVELVLSVALLSIILFVAFAFYNTFRGSYMEQIATVQCQASARMAENHILSNLRRSYQGNIKVYKDNMLVTDGSEGNKLTVDLPGPTNQPDIIASYYVAQDSKSNAYNLVLEKNGVQYTIAQYVNVSETVPGFSVKDDINATTHDSVITFKINTAQTPKGQRLITYNLSASHKIRIDLTPTPVP